MQTFDENDKKSIREKTIEFVKDAVTTLKGVVELYPDVSRFPKDAKQFNYRFVNQRISGNFTLSGEEEKAVNANVFDYLFVPDKQLKEVDVLLPKSRFVSGLLTEVFDRYSILSHRVGELTTPLKPAPVFAPSGTVYSLVSGSTASGKTSTMTVIEAHMAVECKLQGATETFIDIMVCDEKGCPISAEQQVKYLRRRKAMLSDFDSSQIEEVSDADRQFFQEHLQGILENVMNGWKDTLSYPRDNKLGQYFKKVEAQFNFELAQANGQINPEPFRPTVELQLLSLYYLQTPCVEFDYVLKDTSTSKPKARFSLRVNRNDNKTVFHCGVCDADCEVSTEGEQLFICAESGEVFSEHCNAVTCLSFDENQNETYIHPGNEHKKWLSTHPNLNAPPKNCTLCQYHDNCFGTHDDSEHYVCSDNFHQCGEQGCKEAVCENLVKQGLAGVDKKSGVYFCVQHMGNVCSLCGSTVSSEYITECSCGQKYCLDCASQKLSVCSSCGKKICSQCGIHVETDDCQNNTGTVLCDDCYSECSCGAVVAKDNKFSCSLCNATQKCSHCKSNEDFFDLQRLSEDKKRDIMATLSLEGNERICVDCIKLCPGNCEVCPNLGSYCEIGSSLEDKIIDRSFPADQRLWGTCECCGEQYPYIFLFNGKCFTCLHCESMLLDDSAENIAQMRQEFIKHKNKIHIAIQIQLKGAVNAISENQTRLVITNKNKRFVLDKTNGKGKLTDRRN